MKNINVFLIFLFLTISSSNIFAQTSRNDSIHSALIYQRTKYPVSQYRDVYKNFMQDFYGPGHLINDKRVACDNILKEMNSVEYYDGPDYEPTGFQGNFYRVNLRLISEGIIPYQTYLNAFVESVQSIQQPEFQYWIQIWKEIDHQISEMNWTFENEDQDRKDIYEGFREGKFIVHHSDAYNKAVNFHYRIISKDNFNKIILPLINQSKDTK